VRTLLRGATLVDGTGSSSRLADVLLEGERVAEVAPPGGTSLAPERVVDLTGLTLAPGFIDVHSHGDFSLPFEPTAGPKALQGVTTEIVGNCGLGMHPSNERVDAMYERIGPIVFGEGAERASTHLGAYRERLHRAGVGVNVASLVPHGNIRCAVMGMADRAPTESELGDMRGLVDEAMRHGAFGFSTGLIYPPGASAPTGELVALASAMRPYGGVYTSHVRNEGAKLLPSVEEAIEVGERAGVAVQVSHLKAAGQPNWGKVHQALALIERAAARGLDVHCDVYPYAAGSTVLSAMFVPIWAFDGSVDETIARLRDPATRARIVADAKDGLLKYVELPRWLSWFPKRWLLPFLIRKMGELVVVSSVRRQHRYEGMPIGAIARERGKELHEAMLDLLLEEETAVAAIAHVMSEDDVRAVLRHPRAMIGTDALPLRSGKPHPRSFGTYPRVLGHYVREVGLLSLEQAVHRMTGLVASKFGLAERGVVRPGAFADLVAFDAARLVDRSTYEEPRRSPAGVVHVWVSGTATVEDGALTGALPGRVLARG
jgi:N-acyl-D-amino-acid deacylase